MAPVSEETRHFESIKVSEGSLAHCYSVNGASSRSHPGKKAAAAVAGARETCACTVAANSAPGRTCLRSLLALARCHFVSDR